MCRFMVENVYSHLHSCLKFKLSIFNDSPRPTFVLSKVYNSMENTSAVRILRNGFNHTTCFGYTIYVLCLYFKNFYVPTLLFRSFHQSNLPSNPEPHHVISGFCFFHTNTAIKTSVCRIHQSHIRPWRYCGLTSLESVCSNNMQFIFIQFQLLLFSNVSFYYWSRIY